MAERAYFDVFVSALVVDKSSKKFAELKRLAKRANNAHGEDKRNIAVVWLPGGKVAFRFFNRDAAQSFKSTAPDGVFP